MSALPPPSWVERDETMLRRAIDVARDTPPADVPVGAVIYDAAGVEIAHAHNRKETNGDPTAHAEILAIRDAVGVIGDGWRLEGCTLAVTLEPCAMCAGAIAAARIQTVVFGAYEPKTGACGSVIDVLRDPVLPGFTAVRGGVLEQPCAHLMEEFFSNLR